MGTPMGTPRLSPEVNRDRRDRYRAGTTRAERQERADSRETARNEARHMMNMAAENLENRIQDWIVRLISMEETVRSQAQDMARME